jgi:hypothetical protein
MNETLDIALKFHRFWRDVGNDILLIGVLAEFLIDLLWLEPPEIFPLLRGRHATTPLLKWYRHLLTMKGVAVGVVNLMVFAGIFLERWQGAKADDVSDQIRTDLQRRIIFLTPRYRVLSPEAEQRISTALKPFAGQRVAIVEHKWQIKIRPHGNAFLPVATGDNVGRWRLAKFVGG